MNVILGVGFGPGPLMRENILEEIPNAPYIFPGRAIESLKYVFNIAVKLHILALNCGEIL